MCIYYIQSSIKCPYTLISIYYLYSTTVGPYMDSGSELVTSSSMGQIDPTYFQDTNGTQYLIWKRGKPKEPSYILKEPSSIPKEPSSVCW